MFINYVLSILISQKLINRKHNKYSEIFVKITLYLYRYVIYYVILKLE